MKNEDKPIIVVGGGLAGLSLAAALGQDRQRVLVLEQAAEIAPVGYGVMLGPNVFDVFDKLGVSAQVKAKSDFPKFLVMPDTDSGETLARISVTSEAYKKRFKHPYITIHRADVHDILLDACRRSGRVELVVNAAVTDFDDRGSEGVRVRCADGRSFDGVALVGADGIRSRVRSLIAGEQPPLANGFVAQRTIIDMKDAPQDLPHREDVALWVGPGYHVVHYPLYQASKLNIAIVYKAPDHGPGQLQATHEQDVQHVYAHACPALKKLLSLMDLERRWPTLDRDPIRQWSRGRATLLGDAAHATLQAYAQGAGMAIEDAACLADLLRASAYDYEHAFQAFPKQRVVRTARIQLGSRQLWDFYHLEGLAREVRDAELKERVEDDYYRCLNWVWSGDPSLAETKRPK